MKVENMKSRNGNAIPNQFIITDGNTEYFQSYKTIVAKRENGKITIDKGNPFSLTTSKHLYSFLNVTSQEFKANMKVNKYDIQALNS